MTAPTLIVVSYYDQRPSTDLARLLRSSDRFPAGAAYDLVIVANRTSDTPLDLALPAGARLLERANTGMNIGAWDHGWRSAPGYATYLFLQDECFAAQEGWLAAYQAKLADAKIGLLGESLNPAWDKSWGALRRERAGDAIREHMIDGRTANRVDVYLDFMRRIGIEPGRSGRHLRSVAWAARREVLEAIDGFPIGANYGECIAAEIAVSRKVEALGLRVEQVADEPFRFIRHIEYNRARPGAPYTHAAADAEAAGAVIFRVHDASPLMASTRYRAIMPALGLRDRGQKAVVTAGGVSDVSLIACRCIVFAKAFSAADVELAELAHALGAPIVLDLCDDMFVADYNGGRGAYYTDNFRAMARLASAVVSTGPVLADVIRDIAPDTRVEIIPDQVETPALTARALGEGAATQTPSIAARAAFAIRNPGAALKRAGERLAALSQASAATTGSDARTIIWFGNHGAAHSAFGMGELARLIPDISEAARHHAIKLLVVSNSREKFQRLFTDAPFAAEYREWSPTRIFGDLDEADVCLIPMPEERFSRAKSANRVGLALSRGTAVIADDFPALADFHPAVIVGDWAGGLRAYLSDETRRQADIARGQAIIASAYSAQAVAARWADLIESLPKRMG